MTYEEAQKLRVGDHVLMVGNPTKMTIVALKNVEIEKTVKLTCTSSETNIPITYAHQAVEKIIPHDAAPTRYFQIVAFNKPEDIDAVCQSHLYPSYVSCMLKKGFYKPFNVKETKEEPLMLQSNFADGLAFTEIEYIPEIMKKAVKTWPNKEFHIVEMDAFVFGKRTPRWVVNG